MDYTFRCSQSAEERRRVKGSRRNSWNEGKNTILVETVKTSRYPTPWRPKHGTNKEIWQDIAARLNEHRDIFDLPIGWEAAKEQLGKIIQKQKLRRGQGDYSVKSDAEVYVDEMILHMQHEDQFKSKAEEVSSAPSSMLSHQGPDAFFGQANASELMSEEYPTKRAKVDSGEPSHGVVVGAGGGGGGASSDLTIGLRALSAASTGDMTGVSEAMVSGSTERSESSSSSNMLNLLNSHHATTQLLQSSQEFATAGSTSSVSGLSLASSLRAECDCLRQQLDSLTSSTDDMLAAFSEERHRLRSNTLLPLVMTHSLACEDMVRTVQELHQRVLLMSKVRSALDKESCLSIRKTVFVEEQGVDLALECDEVDCMCTHFIVRDSNGVSCATGRWRFKFPGVIKIERCAVLKEYRGGGVGALLLKGILEDLPYADEIMLNAQTRAVPFYERLGFQVCGDEFEEAGIKHFAMRFEKKE